MYTINLSFLKFTKPIVVIMAAWLLNSCGFCVSSSQGDLCPMLAKRPFKNLTSSNERIVYENPGQLIVYEGHSCAQTTEDLDIVKVEQRLQLPAYATQATVFLNGWKLGYMNGDHHIRGIGTIITNIQMERNTISWQAAGILSDKNNDDDYNWCYSYTVLAWSPNALDLFVNQQGDSCYFNPPELANYFGGNNKQHTTSLSISPTFLYNPEFATRKTVAVLPRGYGFALDCDEDHHLLQLAYNMDHAERFVEKDRNYLKTSLNTDPPGLAVASRVDSSYVSWESSFIYKDNSARRSFTYAELVSGLAGDAIGIVQPPFSILPFEDEAAGSLSSGGVRTQEFIVENIPYNCAIPMLTGWDVGYITSDQHVKEIGIWIDKIEYTKPPGAATGTLRYRLSSILKDKDENPDFYTKHKVTILGLQPTTGREIKSNN